MKAERDFRMVTGRGGGLVEGIIYASKVGGTVGEAWRYECHGNAACSTLCLASGRLVSYLGRLHLLRCATAREKQRYRRAVREAAEE